MRRYDAEEVFAFLKAMGYEQEEKTGHHVVYVKMGGILILPVPSADGTFNADYLDTLFSERWVPVRPGQFRDV